MPGEARQRMRRPQKLCLPLGLSLALGLSGCAASPNSGGAGNTGATGGSGTGQSAPSPPNPNANITGNWQIQMTSTQGPLPFTGLSGFVNELSGSTSSQSTTASLMPGNAPCYANSQAIPLDGNIQGTKIFLVSFPIDSQVLALYATQNQAGTSLTGTWSVTGGCADGAVGTLSGTLYQPLTGTYTGSFAGDPTKTLSLSLAQYQLGTEDGTFLISGTAKIQGFSCFSSGSMAPGGTAYVTGNTAALVFATSDGNGAHLELIGQFDPAANGISVNSIQVTGDSCAGSYGGAILARQ